MQLLDRFSKRVDYHQTVQYATVMERIGWDAVFVSGQLLFSRRVGPIAIAKFQRPQTIDFEALSKVQKRLHIVQVFVEPGLSLLPNGDEWRKYGLHATTNHHAYTKTAILDLSMPIEKILRNCSVNIRRDIVKSEASKIRIETTQFADLTEKQRDEILALHDRWGKERSIIGYDNGFLRAIWVGFAQHGYMITAFDKEKLVGAFFLLLVNGVGLYFYVFTDPRYKQTGISSRLAIEAIKRSMEEGCDIFDFCSVFDERYPTENPRWKGFSEFKRRFHPQYIEYPQAFVWQGISLPHSR